MDPRDESAMTTSDGGDLRRASDEAIEAAERAIQKAIEKANAPGWSDQVLGPQIEEEYARKQAESRERFARICENSEAVTERASAEIELRERLEAAADRLATVNLTVEAANQWGVDLASVNAAICRGDENAAQRLDLLEAAVRYERQKMLPAWMQGLR